MGNSKRILLALLAMAVLAVFVVGCGEGTVAKVNGRRISKQEYYNRLERLQLPNQQGGGQSEAGAVVVRRLIDEELILELAEKNHVSPTADQIKVRMQQAQKNPQTVQLLQKSGITPEQFKQMLRVEQAAFNLQTRGVTVSDSEVREFYDKYKDKVFTTPEQAFISWIVLNTPADVDKAQSLLKRGVDFGTVAKSLSIDKATAAQDGRVPRAIFKGDAQIPEALQKAIFGIPAGTFTQPLKIQNKYVICKVNERRPPSTRKFDDVSFDVKQNLMIQKGAQKKIDVNKELGDYRKDAKVWVGIQRYNEAINPPKTGAGK
jgi:foldase protein PrsA